MKKILLFLCCVTLCFTSLTAQVDTLYQENFNAYPSGVDPASFGWTVNQGVGQNRWLLTDCGLDGTSMAVAEPGPVICEYDQDIATPSLRVFRTTPIDAKGYGNIKISFTYKVGGEGIATDPQERFDFGMIQTATNAAGSWTTEGEVFINSAGAINGRNISKSDVEFFLAFHWQNDDAETPDSTGFIIDNIVVTGECVYTQNPSVFVQSPDTTAICTSDPGTEINNQAQDKARIFCSVSAASGRNFLWYRNNAFLTSTTVNYHDATEIGAYYVVLSDRSCREMSDTIEITQREDPPVEIVVASGDSVQCEDMSVVQLMIVTTWADNIRWFWDNDPTDGTPAVQLSASDFKRTHNINGAGAANNPSGEYFVVTGCNTTNRTESNRITIIEYQRPDNPASITTDGETTANRNSYCVGEEIVFHANLSSADSSHKLPYETFNNSTYTFQWYKGNTLISGETESTYTILSATTGDDNDQYRVKVTRNGCQSNASPNSGTSPNYRIDVYPMPNKASVTIDGVKSVEVCEREKNLNFAVSNTGSNVNWAWYHDGIKIRDKVSSFNIPKNAVHRDSTGWYYVISTDSRRPECETYSDSAYLLVKPAPAAPFINALSDTEFCDGDSVVLTSTSGTTYQWFRTNVAITGATNQTYVAKTTGTYKVSITNADGCTSRDANGDPSYSNEIPVQVYGFPNDPIIEPLGGDTIFCDDGTETLSVTNDPGDGSVLYRWYKDGVLKQGPNQDPEYVTNEAGTYYVLANSNNPGDCPSDTSNKITLTTKVAPAGTSVTPPGPINFCDSNEVTLYSASNVNNQWYRARGGGSFVKILSSEGGTLPELTVQAKDLDKGILYKYYVTIIEDGCESTPSNTVEITNDRPNSVTIEAPNGTSGCEGTDSVLLTIDLLEDLFVDGDIVWYEETAGAVTDTLDGGEPESRNYYATVAGLYYVIIIDESGCSSDPSNKIPVGFTAQPEAFITPASDQELCTGDSVVLTAYTPVTGYIYSAYQWYRDGLPILDGTEKTYTALVEGAYSVVISDGDCDSEPSATVEVIVNPRPDRPSIKVEPEDASACTGDSVTLIFEDYFPALDPNDPPYDFYWFMVGSPDTLKEEINATSSQFKVGEAGTYYLVAAKGDCSSDTSNNIHVTFIEKPFTPIIVADDDTSICVGDSATLRVESHSEYIQWFFNGAEITGATNVTYEAKQAGDYSVVVDPGCPSETSNSITITTQPKPADPVISAQSTTDICAPGSVVLELTDPDATPPAGFTIEWFKDNVPTDSSSTTFTATESGVYYVILTGDANSCPSDTSNKIRVTVTEKPVEPSIFTNDPNTFCQPDSALLEVSNYNGNSGVDFQWFRNDAPISGATDETYSATTSGRYVLIVSENECDSDSSNALIITANAQTEQPIVTPESASLCPDGSDTLRITTSYTDPTYQWFRNDVEINGAITSELYVNQTGSYYAIVTDGPCPSDQSNTVEVTENYPDSVTIDVLIGATEICEGGDPVTLYINPPEVNIPFGDTLTFQWFKNDTAITGETEQQLTTDQPGVYHITVSNQDECESAPSNKITVTAPPRPIASISTNDSTNFCEGGEAVLVSDSAHTEYEWYRDGIVIVGATGALYTATIPGEYHLIGINGDCESDTSNKIEITVSINPLTPAIEADGPTEFCNGGNVVLISDGGNNLETVTHEWFEESTGTLFGETTDRITVTTSGTYYAIVKNEGCSSDTSNKITVTVTVLSGPPVIATDDETNICAPDSAVLKVINELPEGADVEWYKKRSSGDVIVGTGMTFAAMQTGTYYAIFIAIDCESDKSNKIAILISASPEAATITADGPTNFCEGDDVTLTSSVTNNIEWYKDEMATGQTAPSYTVSESGSYYVVSSNSQCETGSSDTIDVVVSNPNDTAIITTDRTPILCQGDSVELTSSVTTGIEWYKDATATGVTTASYKVAEAGDYHVVRPAGFCGSLVSDTVTVVVNAVPTKPIIYTNDPTTFCKPDSAVLEVFNHDDFDVQWFNNSGEISGATDTFYVAKTSNSYYAQLTSAEGCSSDTSDHIVVVAKPKPATPVISTTNDVTFCQPDSVILTSNTANGNQWYEENIGELTGETNQNYTTTVSGSYYVVVTNAQGCASDTSNHITIVANPKPATPTISTTDANPTCSPDSVVLTSNAVSGNQWYKESTGAIDGAVKKTYAAITSGSYYVVVTTPEGCASDTSNHIDVVINAKPITPVVSTNNETTFCQPDSAILSSSATTGNQWYEEATGQLAGETNQTYAAKTSGSYYVIVTSAQGCASDTSNHIVITVYPKPITPVINTTDATTFCKPDSALLRSNTISGNQWYEETAGELVGEDGKSYVARTSGSYYVIVTSADSCESDTSNHIDIVANEIPTTPVISGPDDSTFCEGDFVRLISNQTSGNQWYEEAAGVLAGETNDTLEATVGGTYFTIVTLNNCASDTSNMITVNTKPKPDAPYITPDSDTSLCRVDTIMLSSDATAGIHQWYKDSVAIAGANDDTYKVTEEGVYHVFVTLNGCESDQSNSVTVTKETPDTPSISSIGSNTSFCEGADSVRLQVDPVLFPPFSNLEYQWYEVTAGELVGETEDNYTATTSGSYYAVAIDPDNGCESEASNIIIVTASPKPIATITAVDTNVICEGGFATLVSDSIADTYQWYKDGLQIFGATDSIYEIDADGFDAEGDYHLVITTGGCASDPSNTITITVVARPDTPIIESQDGLVFCVGDSAVLEVSNHEGHDVQWYEQGTGMLVSETDTFYVAKDSGVFFVILNNTADCVSDTSNLVEVISSPEPETPIIATNDSTTFCQPDSAVLEVTNHGGYTVQWYELADGALTGAADTFYVAKDSGTYFAILTSGDNCSSDSSNFISVVANPQPTTPILTTNDATTFCQPDSAVLEVSNHQGLTVQWFDELGEIVNETDTFYVAKDSGSYYAVLTGTEACESDTSNHIEVVANSKPETPIVSTNDATTFCQPDSAVLTVANHVDFDLQWYDASGEIVGETDTFYVAKDSGSYYAVLTSAEDCESDTSNHLVIIATPQPTTPILTTNDATTFCQPDSAVLEVSNHQGLTVQWFDELGEIVNETDTFYVAKDSGSYYAVLTSTEACESDTSNHIEVVANSKPETPIVSTNDATTFCQPDSAVLEVSNHAGYDVQWFEFPGIELVGETDTFYVAKDSGVFYAVLKFANCESDTSNNVTINANPQPNTPSISTADAIEFCQPDSAILEVSGHANLDVQWYMNGSEIVGAVDTFYVTKDSGNYYALVVNENDCKSDTSNHIEITSNPQPETPIIDANDATEFCQGDSTFLFVSNHNGLGVQWYEETAGMLPGETDTSYAGKSSGSYYAVLTSGQNCSSDTSNHLELIMSLPPATPVISTTNTDFCEGDSTTLVSSSVEGTQWYEQTQGLLNGEVDSAFTTTESGTYYVLVTNDEGCVSDTSNKITTTVIPKAESPSVTPKDTAICNGDTVTISVDVSSGIEWYRDGVATGVTTQTIEVFEDGFYSVLYTVNGCDARSDSSRVTVLNALDTSDITADGPTDFCEGDSVTLYSSIVDGIEWYKDGIATGHKEESFTVSETGQYYVQEEEGLCADISSDTVQVNSFPYPDAPSITPSGDHVICQDDSIMLTTDASDGITWYRNGIATGDTTSSIIVDSEGDYSLTVRSNGCISNSTDTVNVSFFDNESKPTIAPDGPAFFCEGEDVVLRSSVANSYQWYEGGNKITGAINRQLFVDSAGDYVVAIMSDAGCEIVSDTFRVEVYPRPAQPSVSPSGTQTICYGDVLTLTSSDGVAYQWYQNDVRLVGANAEELDISVSGDYYVTINDSNGCENSSEIVMVTVRLEEKPVVTVEPSESICSNETATLTSNYETGNQWYRSGFPVFGATSQTYITSITGDYFVSVTEAGCTRASDPVRIEVSSAPAKPTIDPTDTLICKTQSLILTSSSAPNYQWYRDGMVLVGERAQTYEATEGGKYTVTVSSANGCSATSDTTTLTVRFEDGVTISPSDTTVCSNEIVTLSSSEPIGNEWHVDNLPIQGATAQTYEANAPGIYTVRVIRDGCVTWSDAVTIIHEAAPEKPDIQTDDNTQFCGGESATLYTTAANVVNYQWYKDGFIIAGAIASTHEATETGDYQVEVQNAAGCKEISDVLTIQLLSQPRIANTVVTDNSCFGREEGSIRVTAQDGSAPYSYALGNNNPYQPDNTFSNLAAGTYMIYLIDAKGCEDSTEVTVNDADESLEVNVNLDRDISCADADDGQITATATGGVVSYLYSINQTENYQPSGTFSGLPEGAYTVTVKDENGCQAISESVFITNPDSMFVDANRDNDITCYNDNDGKITTNVEGGIRPYLYSINGVDYQNDSLFINLKAGTYRVTVQDARGCVRFSDPVQMTNPAPLEFQSAVFVQNAQCFGEQSGRIAVVASGGTEGYTYHAGVTQQGGQPSDTIDVFAGVYRVWVEDANGCVDSAINSITITEPSEIIASVSEVQQLDCFQGTNGSIHVTATGGTGGILFTIGDFDPNPLLTNTTGEFDNLTEGFYQVQVKDANNCIIDLGVQPIFPRPAFTLETTVTQVSCYGFNDGQIQTAVTGGASGPKEYRLEGETDWDYNSIFIGLSPGTYTVQVRDLKGCIAEMDANVIEPLLLSVIAAGTDISCFGLEDGEMQADASGGTGQLMYTLSSNSNAYTDGPQPNNLFAGLPQGKFAIVVMDANGCRAITDSIDIIEPAEVFVSIAKVNDVICNGAADGRIQATSGGGVGGYEYKLTGADDITYQTNRLFEDLAPGTYGVTTRDANGCTSFSGTITIVEPPLLRITTSEFTDITCYGANDGIIEFAALGGVGFIQYSVNGVDFFNIGLFENLAPGVYAITARDQKGCISEAVTDTVIEPGELIAFANVDQHISCNGETDGQITVLMSGGMPPFEYSIDGGTSYQSSPTYTGLSKNNYIFHVRDANGCETISNATNIIDPPQISVVATLEEEISCNNANDGVIRAEGFGGTGAYKFSLDGSTFTTNNVFASLAPGTYSVYIKDVNSCISIAPAVVLTNPAALILNIEVMENVSCFGGDDGRIRITGSGGAGSLLYSVNGGTTYQVAQVFSNLKAGNYTCVVKDANGCTQSKSVDVLSPERFDITTTEVHHYYSATDKGYIDLEVNNIIPPVSYNWSHGPTTQDVTGLLPSNYTCIITDGNGCLQDTTIEIIDSSSVGLEEQESNINIYPNPSTGLVTVAWEGWKAGDTYRLEVLNAIGEVVYNKQLAQVSESAKASIDLTGRSEGVYFVQIYNQDQTPISTLRLMLQ